MGINVVVVTRVHCIYLHRCVTVMVLKYRCHNKEEIGLSSSPEPIYQPALEKKVLIAFRFVVLQLRMHSPLFELHSCVFAWSFLKVPTKCLRIAKGLARLRLCTGSPEPLLVSNVISTLFSCSVSYIIIRGTIYMHLYQDSCFEYVVKSCVLAMEMDGNRK